jgi:hypothetical protein
MILSLKMTMPDSCRRRRGGAVAQGAARAVKALQNRSSLGAEPPSCAKPFRSLDRAAFRATLKAVGTRNARKTTACGASNKEPGKGSAVIAHAKGKGGFLFKTGP